MHKNLLLLLFVLSNALSAQDPCADLNVDFTFGPDPNGIAFTDASTVAGAITWYQWSFGDGNISFVQNPVHSFAVSGIYEVCLIIGTSIETPEGIVECLDSACYMVEYDQGGFSCDQYAASFTAELVEGSTMVFFSTTDPPGGNQFWQFGDGNNGSGQQVTHTFDTTGTFTVCLVSSLWNSATEEFCNDVTCLPVVVADTLDCDNLSPTFTSTLIGGTTVLFEETTDPQATSYYWDFGDNSTATGPIAEHTYAEPGTYEICLGASWWNEVAQDSCWKYTCDLFHLITPEECDPDLQIGFGWSQSEGTVSFFADVSVQAGGYFWDFGNGAGSTGAVAEYQFTFGEHLVCLESWYLPNELSDTCWTIFCDTIIAAPGSTGCNELDLSFIASSLAEGLQLTNSSEVPGIPIAFEWSFGDGAFGSGADVIHEYPAVGDYEVCLTVSSLIGPINDPDTCISTICDMVTWSGGADPCAGLEASFIGVEMGPLQWTFENTTDPLAIGLQWDLGDGSLATGESVTHTYEAPGDHEVCLTAWWWDEANKDSCISTTCEIFTVTGGTECEPGFEVDLTWQQTANQFNFTATTNVEGAQIIWDLGDGNTGAGAEISHLYEPPGPFTVCASAWYWNDALQDSCWATTCHEIQWNASGCDPLFTVSITAEADQNTVTLNAISSTEAISHIWDFGDGNTGAGETVTHTFQPPGPFEVCVDSWYWEPVSADTCWAEACITIDPFLWILENEIGNAITIFPQPAKDVLVIDGREGIGLANELRLYGNDGRLLKIEQVKQWPHRLSIGDLSPGIFLLRLQFEDLRIDRRVIKE